MRAPGVAEQALQAYFLDCIRRYAFSQELLMAAVHPPRSAPIAVTDCRDLSAGSELETAPAATASAATGDGPRRLAAAAAGAVLVVAGVAGLHHLQRSGHSFGDWTVWVAVLLVWLTVLGGGIKLATWGLRPVIDAAFDAGKQRLSEAAQSTIAALGIVFGSVGLWWTLRGGYTQWWQSISGEPGWSLTLGVGQMAVAVFAGAALFTGGKYLAGLAGEVLADAGLIRTEDTERPGAHRNPVSGKDAPSHPMLVAALIVGALALVAMTVWLTPMLAPTIIGTNTLAAAAAIAAVLVWAVGANLGWWKGLEGLYQWATAASQKASAIAGVVAVLMFSAGGLGLGWFTPATVPQAHAQCPPDCGGGSNGSNSYGPDASQFQPPQMQSQLPDYQSGGNQAPMDQNSSVSIYNTQAPSVSQNTGSSGQGAQQPQQGWDQPAHGTQIPNYQTAAPYTQGPGQPNPDYHGGQSNPGTNTGSQGGQANQSAPQQQAPQQPPANQSQPTQQQPGQQPQQPGQQQPDQQQQINDLTKQLQDQQQQSTQDRQKLDDLTKQLQQQGQQKQSNQKLPKAPSKDKKQDEKNQQDQDNQSGNNDLSALLLGAASTRRRKQDEQGQPQQGQQQSQGPDTQALAQDGAQMGQSLPADITNTVSDSVNLGQSAGSATQNFGSAAQAGASLASSAQSGAVNPMDAVALVQGISGGISDTADAVNSGTSIASTWLNEAGQGAQLAADANPQLEPQMQQVQQLTKTAGQVSELTGQVASGVSQVSGLVNTASSLESGGLPDTSDAGDLLSEGGTTIPMSGGSGTGIHQLGPAPMEPTTPTPTPPNYPEVPRTITPTPPSTNPPTTPSTSPPTPPPPSSPTPEPHLSPPVTAPGPAPETPPSISAAPPSESAPPSTTVTSPPPTSQPTTPPHPPFQGITEEQFKQIYNKWNLTSTDGQHYTPLAPDVAEAKAQGWTQAINAAMQEFEINTPLRQSAFLAESAEETDWAASLTEYADGSEYQGILGNVNPGDGKLFKGRGGMQLTARGNYEPAAKALGIPEIVTNPDIVAQDLPIAFRTAGWYWRHGNGDLNPFADQGDLLEITHRVNGGTNGLDARIQNYNKILKMLGG